MGNSHTLASGKDFLLLMWNGLIGPVGCRCRRCRRGAPVDVFGCIMFAGIAGSVEDAFAPELLELLLSIPAFEPVETLVHGFGGSGSHGAHG
jgi:hypothetical protein